MLSTSLRLTKRRFLVIALAIVWAIAAAIGASYLFKQPLRKNDVTIGLGRAGRLMNILIPAQLGRGERMISIYNDGDIQYWSPQDTGVFATVWADLAVTHAEWQAIVALRLRWCQSPPKYLPISVGAPIYEVGWDCPGDLFAKRVQIPATLIPPEMTRVVERALSK